MIKLSNIHQSDVIIQIYSEHNLMIYVCVVIQKNDALQILRAWSAITYLAFSVELTLSSRLKEILYTDSFQVTEMRGATDILILYLRQAGSCIISHCSWWPSS